MALTRGIRLPVLLGLALLIAWPFVFDGAYDRRVLTLAGIYALLVIGYQLVFGHAGALALTQGTFFGLGAYATGLLATRYGMPVLVTLPAAMALPVVVARIVAVPILRLDSHYLALASLAVAQIVFLLAIGWEPVTGGANGLPGVPGVAAFGFELPRGLPLLALVWVLVALAAFLSWQLTRGPFGRAWQVMRDSPLAAQSIGLDLLHLRRVAFLTGAAFAGVAGALHAHTLRIVSPEVLDFHIMVACLTMTVVGGRTRIAGAILAAVLLVHLPEWLRDLEKYYLIAYGAILLIAIIVAPEGLIGALERLRAWLLPEQPLPALPARALPVRAPLPGTGPLLDIRNVSRSFGPALVLNRVSFDVRRGEILGLIGPNGSGKTTLLNVISGFYPAEAGSILFAADAIEHLPPQRVARRGIGRSFQTIDLAAGMTALDNVAIARAAARGLSLGRALTAPINDPTLNEMRGEAVSLLETLGATESAMRDVTTLSHDARRRVEVARALAVQPHLLMLDEPAAGLDQAGQADLAARLRHLAKGGLTILLVEHNMPFLMGLADRIVCLDQGRVVATGTPADIRADPKVIAAYLGVPAS
jgi:branched-chain amino acid transport system permease protein